MLGWRLRDTEWEESCRGAGEGGNAALENQAFFTEVGVMPEPCGVGRFLLQVEGVGVQRFHPAPRGEILHVLTLFGRQVPGLGLITLCRGMDTAIPDPSTVTCLVGQERGLL